MSLLVRNPNMYYGSGRRRVHRRRRHGGSIFDSIASGLKSAHDYIKSKHLISTVAKGLSSVGVPYAGAIGTAAGALGYGRRRRRRAPVRRRRLGVRRPRLGIRRRRIGGLNVRGLLSSAHGFIKKHQLVSKGLSHFGHSKLAAAASSLGYGRRRRVHRRRRGGLNVRGLLSAAHGFVKKHQLVSKGLSHFGHSKLASAASSLGYGRRRAPVRRHRIHHHHGGSMFTTEQIAVPKF